MYQTEYADTIGNLELTQNDENNLAHGNTTTKKRNGPSLNAANDYGLKTCRLFVTDTYTKINFFIDIGADLYIYPKTFIRRQLYKSDYELPAANGTIINTILNC